MFKGQVIDILAVLTRAAEEVYHNGSVSIDYVGGMQTVDQTYPPKYIVRIYEDGAVANSGQAVSLSDAIYLCAGEFLGKFPAFRILCEAAS